MYHSVADDLNSAWIDPTNHVPAEIFRRQMHFIAERRKVVSLKQLAAMLDRGNTPSPGTVVLTFDDGYRDNLTVAAPILDSLDLTATLFLPTGYIDRAENQWIDQVYSAFSFRTTKRLSWGTAPPAVFNLEERPQYQKAYATVCQDLLTAFCGDRIRLLEVLRQRLAPSASPPRLTLSWEEVQSLSAKHDCFEIGSHTVNHIDLTAVEEREAELEVTSASDQIERQTGTRPRHFSFCYGRTSHSLRRLVAEVGYESACGGDGIDPVITEAADVFRLPRIAAPRSMTRFGVLTSSANTGFWRRLGR